MNSQIRFISLGLIVMTVFFILLSQTPVQAEDTILPSDEEEVGDSSGTGQADTSGPDSNSDSAVDGTASISAPSPVSGSNTGVASATSGSTGNNAGLDAVLKSFAEVFKNLDKLIQNFAQLIIKFLDGINTMDNSVQTTANGNTEGAEATSNNSASEGTTDAGTTTSGATTTDTTETVGNGTTTGTKVGDSAALNSWMGGKLSPTAFAKLLGPAARESMKKSGVPASITLAQAALETGWGRSTIGSAKNLFGIKGKGPAGSVRVPTKEYIGGRTVTVQANFRKYNSWSESIDDHSKLLSQGARYKNCMKNKGNPDQFARELVKAGYATSPSYATQLISIMKKYNFYQYDK